MSSLLDQRIALVTGGTVGIGRGIAEVLRTHGANVIVTGVAEDECAEARELGLSLIHI